VLSFHPLIILAVTKINGMYYSVMLTCMVYFSVPKDMSSVSTEDYISFRHKLGMVSARKVNLFTKKTTVTSYAHGD